jgi:DNA repair ATPase RecN
MNRPPKKDVDAIKAFRNGEIHIAMTMCRKYNITMDELAKRYDKIKEDKDYYKIVSEECNKYLERIKNSKITLAEMMETKWRDEE